LLEVFKKLVQLQ